MTQVDPFLENKPDYAAFPTEDDSEADVRWRVLMHLALEAGVVPEKDHDGWWCWRNVIENERAYDLLLGYSGVIVIELPLA